MANGGTGNHINGEVVFGRGGSNAGTVGLQGGNNCITNFPGYADQWDQLLYRDVRVADGAGLTVKFLYETQMDNRADLETGTRKGWFDRDPLSLTVGNFISSTLSGANAPIDSFMVYVGVPANPTACQYTDGEAPRPIYDLKRRWFSEVIAIDKPYKQILSTFGRDSVYRSTQFSATLSNAVIQPMIDAQGLLNGGGVIRIVFRVKTNANYADETNTGGSFVSTGQGAARIDRVDITGAAAVFATSGFESANEINNTVEPANAVLPGPAVGAGYALASWKATGKPTKLMTHLHPLDGDVTRDYAPLDYKDLCGVWNSPSRLCDINGVIMSTTDHDLFEATGDAAGTAFRDNQGGYMSPAINLIGFDPITGLNDCGLDALHVNTQAKWLIMYDCYTGIFKTLDTQGCLYATLVISYPTLQKNGATVWGRQRRYQQRVLVGGLLLLHDVGRGVGFY